MLRMVRGEEDSVDAATDFRELYLQTIVHREERVVVEQSLAESGLIADDKHAIARLTQPRASLEAAGDRPPFGDGLHVVRRVLIDDAVAVADVDLHGGAFSGRCIGRTHSCTLVTTAQFISRLLHEK